MDSPKNIRKRFDTQNSLQNHGKLPPQAVDIEEGILGAVMLEKGALGEIEDILTQECFYKEAHQLIFGAINRLSLKSSPIDILTVTKELKQAGELDIVGGAFYVTSLTNRIASTLNIKEHALIVYQEHIKREIIRIGSQAIKDAYDDTSDALDLLSSTEKRLSDINKGITGSEITPMWKAVMDMGENLDRIAEQEGDISGIPSGYNELDKKTGGWQKQNLIVIAARPSMGKTALMLAMARNAAVTFKKPVGIFTLEMSTLQCTNRLVAQQTNVPLSRFKKKGMSLHERELVENCDALINAPIYIDDTPAINPKQLRSKVRKMVKDHGIQAVFIDYMQLMTSDIKNQNREGDISHISRQLKAIAKECDIPVIALSQLSREVEKRTNKEPQLSDLRESGAIEQDADMIIFPFRPEYYGIDHDENGNTTQGIALLLIKKNRDGELGSIQLRFSGEHTNFYDVNDVSNTLKQPTRDQSNVRFPYVSKDNDEPLPF